MVSLRSGGKVVWLERREEGRVSGSLRGRVVLDYSSC